MNREEANGWMSFNPITFVLQFVAAYGWHLVLASGVALYAASKLRPRYEAWRQAREDALYHKDPDVALARMEAIQRARDKQQQELALASQRELEKRKRREEERRAEASRLLEEYGPHGGGRRLGSDDGRDYLPLSDGASTSSYRAPKRSACSRGGCGR